MPNQKTPSAICGLDEVGRGPLAGPVTAAAVILPLDFDRSVLGDSKALSPARRIVVERLLRDGGARFALGWADHREIDDINILNASLLAMSRAYAELIATSPIGERISIETVVDGTFCPPEVPRCKAVVGGDRTVPEVMAASIIAKNARDAFMVEYAKYDNRYGFERHKGYPTAAHRAALRLHGASPIHRRSFRGVASAEAPYGSRDTR